MGYFLKKGQLMGTYEGGSTVRIYTASGDVVLLDIKSIVGELDKRSHNIPEDVIENIKKNVN